MVLDILSYIGIGIFDTIAVIVFSLKLYMLPVAERRKRLIGFGILIAIISFFMRVIFNLPKLDLPLQYILFILFFRYGLGIKTHLSAFILGAGISAYAIIQVGVYYLYNFLGIMQTGVLQQNTTLQVYILQVTYITLCFAVSFILKIYNAGFSFIVAPPHDNRRESYFSKDNRSVAVSALLSAVTICVAEVLLYQLNPFVLLLMSASTFGISYFLSRKEDQEDARKALEAHRNRNKKS
ncbi:hypothetical protein J2W98_000473 [Paenibacillus peoriae]|uniref:Uncharacterized protein n=1 Tax=Paenibacillus peoriae TaxID=59893 RepID=A0ABU1Q9C8_9BACL|nr:hypothetical protein [Paenibacillus peoriae]MDR6776226.1 hypothetical protein [Paenibacillus peoriae]